MSITVEDRQAVREAYGYCCGYCGVSEADIGGELQLDQLPTDYKRGRGQRG